MAFHRLERIRNCPSQTLDGIPLTTFTSVTRPRPGNLEALDYHVQQYNKQELKFKSWSFDGTRILKWPETQFSDEAALRGKTADDQSGKVYTPATPNTPSSKFLEKQKGRIEEHERKKALLNRIMDTTDILRHLDRGKTMTTFVEKFDLAPIFAKLDDEVKSIFPKSRDEKVLRCFLERELNSYFGTHEINDKRRKYTENVCAEAKKKLWLREETGVPVTAVGGSGKGKKKTKKEKTLSQAKYWITDKQLDEMLIGSGSSAKLKSKLKTSRSMSKSKSKSDELLLLKPNISITDVRPRAAEIN